MKAKTASPETAVLTAERKLHNTWVYIKRHWQLYLLFLLPAVALTLVFKYAPMGGVLIAFQKYNPFKGIWGSEWVGFKNFTRFMSSPDFQRYLINTLKLSVYGLLWGFPIPILLAFLLNRIESKKIKQKTAYEIRPRDWSSDVCSSDLHHGRQQEQQVKLPMPFDVDPCVVQLAF